MSTRLIYIGLQFVNFLFHTLGEMIAGYPRLFFQNGPGQSAMIDPDFFTNLHGYTKVCLRPFHNGVGIFQSPDCTFRRQTVGMFWGTLKRVVVWKFEISFNCKALGLYPKKIIKSLLLYLLPIGKVEKVQTGG